MFIDDNQILASRGGGLQVVYLGACAGDVAASSAEIVHKLGYPICIRERYAKQPLVTSPVEHLEKIRPIALPAGY